MTSPPPSKLFLLLLLLLHPDTSSYPSPSLLVSGSDQEPKIVEDHGNKAETANETSSAAITAIDRRGGSAGGHGVGGHSASRGGGASRGGRGGGKGRYRGYVGVIPLYAAGAGKHHPNGNHHHGGATNNGCPSYLLAYAILASVLVLLAS